jgi:hypothetical protein
VLPITSNAHSADPAAAASSRRWALNVALVASKPGSLCAQLCDLLEVLHDQWLGARSRLEVLDNRCGKTFRDLDRFHQS